MIFIEVFYFTEKIVWKDNIEYVHTCCVILTAGVSTILLDMMAKKLCEDIKIEFHGKSLQIRLVRLVRVGNLD